MTQDQAEYITKEEVEEGLALLKGESSVAIAPPSRRVERRGKKMVQVEVPAYVKFFTDFKKELADLDVYSLKVLIYIGLSIGFETGTAHPGIRKIAQDTKMDKSTVVKAVAELEEKGFLEVWKREGDSNIYRPARYFSIGETVRPERTPPAEPSAQKPELYDENAELYGGSRVKRAQPDKQDKQKETFLEFEKMKIGHEKEGWKGREIFRPDHYPLVDWYHEATGQDCPKSKQKDWIRFASDCSANGLTVTDLKAAYEMDIKWRGVFTSPNQLVEKAIALKAQNNTRVLSQTAPDPFASLHRMLEEQNERR